VAVHRNFSTKAAKTPKEKLVVLGTGWGAFRVLRSLDYSKYDVTVISPRNHFLFTPLLCSTTTGVLEFRSIMETIRTTNHQFDFIQGLARNIDFSKHNILCSQWLDADQQFEVKYDKLLIGIGADNNTFDIPGVKGNVHFLKELADARSIRNHIIDLLEEASIPGIANEERRRLLNFVVVGGGPTGVEFAAELSDFFWSDVLKYYPNIQIHELKITLVEAGDTILSAFSKKLVEQAMKNIKRQGIDMKLHTRVKEVKPNKIILDDDTVINCGMIVWSTGVGPRKMIREMKDSIPLDHGRLIVNDHLQLKGFDDVYALGDCAMIEGKPLPATAQVANQQGVYLTKLLNGKIPLDKSTNQPAAFQYYPLGLMAYVGAYKTVFDTSLFKGTGWLEFLAWRSVYLTRLGSWKNKMMVPYNWLKTLIWGRDVAHF
jgi:NADH:ubiquinone reductase (non-electrogenic)